MSESRQEFLAKIGPRQLTDAEERQLHLLRIREGQARTITRVFELLAEQAARTQQHTPDDGATERP